MFAVAARYLFRKTNSKAAISCTSLCFRPGRHQDYTSSCDTTHTSRDWPQVVLLEQSAMKLVNGVGLASFLLPPHHQRMIPLQRQHTSQPSSRTKKSRSICTVVWSSMESPPSPSLSTASSSLSCKRRFPMRSSLSAKPGGADDGASPVDEAGATADSFSPYFRRTTAADARSLTDGILLTATHNRDSDDDDYGGVILPWMGYGTYKLGKEVARQCTLEALRRGYRCLDTAFIYGGETTERQVGLAIQDAIEEGVVKRSEVVVVTKQWRKYHGYDATMECLRLSLQRLNLDYIDIWLMHWPGPAWKSMNRRKDDVAKYGSWHNAVHSKEEMPLIRAESWRAMEDAVTSGKVRAIGVCNFTIEHLERLKRTATIMPAVNQVECHPLFPQTDLLEYCAAEGIVVQAYSSLGGQDAGKKFWQFLYPPDAKKGKETNKTKQVAVTKLSETPPVLELAAQVDRTPAQILLRWALEKNLALVPKTSSTERMVENAAALEFSLSQSQVDRLDRQLQGALLDAAKRAGNEDVHSMARLCWRNDPLRDLRFD